MTGSFHRWPADAAKRWYADQPWLLGCNFLPGLAVNQLEMWQEETWDPAGIGRELGWAESLGFNTMRVYLHDLVWREDADGFAARIDAFLGIAFGHGMRTILVLFDDSHRPDPRPGPQPPPLRGAHNSQWMQSPGRRLVEQFHDGSISGKERRRLERYVMEVLSRFSGDERVLMWDVYNEPGQGRAGDISNELLAATWTWASEIRPSQPLTSCVNGLRGQRNLELNERCSDVITFHSYVGDELESLILRMQEKYGGRPLVCTEYMARELGTTFQRSLPIFRRHNVGCCNWGLVAGRSQTHFNWQTNGEDKLEALRQSGAYLRPGDPIPEPEPWFHDIFRMDGSPYDPAEVALIRAMARDASGGAGKDLTKAG